MSVSYTIGNQVFGKARLSATSPKACGTTMPFAQLAGRLMLRSGEVRSASTFVAVAR